VSENVNAAPVAGWYPDPADESKIRYWDGEKWTDHVADRNAPQTTAWSDGKNDSTVVTPVRDSQDTAKAAAFIVGFTSLAFLAIAMLLFTS
jgi:hypothetical protein